MYKITYTEKFKKHYKKFHPNEKEQIKNKIKIMAKNPMHPSLRSKRIKGTKHLFEFSVNMDIRIIWYYENDLIVILSDIGHHDILKKI